MTTVLCVGLVVADAVFDVASVPAAGTKSFATARSEQAGGPAATAAVTVARLGGSAAFAGRVGDDSAGRMLLDELTGHGVDVSAVEVLDGVASSASIVFVTPDGERTIVNHTDRRLLEDGAPVVTADAVLVDVRWVAGARHALTEARLRRIPSVLDLDRSPDPELGMALARLATHPVASLDAARELTSESTPERCLAALDGLTSGGAIVTAGDRGAWHLDGGVAVHVPAPHITAVETLGAGDVFHGAFVWAIAAGMPPGRAIEAASLVAADRCTRRGGWNAIPTEVPWN